VHGTLVDLRGTAARAADAVAAAGLSDRIATVGQSVFDPLPAGADVVAPGLVAGLGSLERGGGVAVVRAGEGRLPGAAVPPWWSGAPRSVVPRTGLPGVLGGMYDVPASAEVSDLRHISASWEGVTQTACFITS